MLFCSSQGGVCWPAKCTKIKQFTRKSRTLSMNITPNFSKMLTTRRGQRTIHSSGHACTQDRIERLRGSASSFIKESIGNVGASNFIVLQIFDLGLYKPDRFNVFNYVNYLFISQASSCFDSFWSSIVRQKLEMRCRYTVKE